MVMSPINILEVMSFRMSTRVTATVVCCILMQLLCVLSQKASASGGLRTPDPPPGLRPWNPLGSPDPQSSFMSPNNPVRSTPLVTTQGRRQRLTSFSIGATNTAVKLGAITCRCMSIPFHFLLSFLLAFIIICPHRCYPSSNAASIALPFKSRSVRNTRRWPQLIKHVKNSR